MTVSDCTTRPTLDHDTMLYVLEELQAEADRCRAYGRQRATDGSELGRVICEDQAASFERFAKLLGMKYRMQRHIDQ